MAPDRPPQPSSPTNTAFDPRPGTDQVSPDPVERIETVRARVDTVTVRWSPAVDNVGVVSYRVWLDGFRVAETSQTQTTLDWFNDGASQHVVQVKARDAAGNEAETSPSLMVTRPSPRPSPTADPSPSSSASATPRPTADPSLEPEPSSTAPPSTSPQPSGDPSSAEPTPGAGALDPAEPSTSPRPS